MASRVGQASRLAPLPQSPNPPHEPPLPALGNGTKCPNPRKLAAEGRPEMLAVGRIKCAVAQAHDRRPQTRSPPALPVASIAVLSAASTASKPELQNIVLPVAAA